MDDEIMRVLRDAGDEGMTAYEIMDALGIPREKPRYVHVARRLQSLKRYRWVEIMGKTGNTNIWRALK